MSKSTLQSRLQELEDQYEARKKFQANQAANQAKERDSTHQMREQLRDLSRKFDTQLIEKLSESQRKAIEVNAHEALILVQAELIKYKSRLPSMSAEHILQKQALAQAMRPTKLPLFPIPYPPPPAPDPLPITGQILPPAR